RNQFNKEYLKACFDEGITVVRSNPLDWFWNIDTVGEETLWKRFNRGLDAYYPIGKDNIYSLKSLRKHDQLPICMPASRLLRPYNPRELFLNKVKINRIRSEMSRATTEGKVY